MSLENEEELRAFTLRLSLALLKFSVALRELEQGLSSQGIKLPDSYYSEYTEATSSLADAIMLLEDAKNDGS